MSLKDISDSLKEKKQSSADNTIPINKEFVGHGENINMRIHTIPALKLLHVNIPMGYINAINEHIDNVIIPNNKSFADGLVGQINQDKKSAQLDFPFDTEFGQEFQKFMEMCGTTYLQKAHDRQSKAEAFQCWTVHSYAGDYNPFHSHGVHTRAGLSCILYLKVPKCIEHNYNGETMIKLTEATGQCDGWTQLIWGQNTRKELYELKHQEQEYIMPIVGKLILFPHWLNHQVMPFFGEGERRTLSCNFNVYDTKEESMKYMSEREKKIYESEKK